MSRIVQIAQAEETFWPLAEYFRLAKVVLALDFDKL